MSEFVREAIRLYMEERGVAAAGAPPTGRDPQQRAD